MDQSIVEKVIEEKRNGIKNKTIAQVAGVLIRHVQALWRKYKDKTKSQYLEHMDIQANRLLGCRGHFAALTFAQKKRHGARLLEDVIEFNTGIYMPHLSFADAAVSSPSSNSFCNSSSNLLRTEL